MSMFEKECVLPIRNREFSQAEPVHPNPMNRSLVIQATLAPHQERACWDNENVRDWLYFQFDRAENIFATMRSHHRPPHLRPASYVFRHRRAFAR